MIRKWLNPSEVFDIKYSLFFIRKKMFWNLSQKLRECHGLKGVWVPLKSGRSTSKSPLQNFYTKYKESIPASNLREKLISGLPVWQSKIKTLSLQFIFPSSPFSTPFINGRLVVSFSCSWAVLSSLIFSK